jgi:hypothetical protein
MNHPCCVLKPASQRDEKISAPLSRDGGGYHRCADSNKGPCERYDVIASHGRVLIRE